MIAELSKRITSFFVRKKYIESAEIENYNYCFEILVSTLLNLASVIALAFITTRYIESLIFIIVFMAMRNFSGGYHAKTHAVCFLSLLLIYGALIGTLYFRGSAKERI